MASKISIFTSTISDGNMSFVKGNKKQVIENRRNFLKLKKINSESVIFTQVSHGFEVASVSQQDWGRRVLSEENVFQVDGLISKGRSVYLMLLTADCLPIVIFDSKKEVISLIHVSRINIQKIISETMKKLNNLKLKPSDLEVNIGPSIGPCHYEIDLWNIAEEELKKYGVLLKNIKNERICTFESREYFSHRRAVKTKENDFRFMTIVGLQ